MTRAIRHSLVTAAALLALGTAGLAVAQSASLAAAIADGSVGEQADGYLGAARAVSPDIRAQMEALNIKRRAAYTEQAAKHGVALGDWAATIGCQTLRRVGTGQSYRLNDGAWRIKGAEPIALPPVCG